MSKNRYPIVSANDMRTLQRRRFTGTRKFDGSRYNFSGLATNKADAQVLASRMRKIGINARTVKLKSINKTAIYFGKRNRNFRTYNAIRFPWRTFERPGGIDQPALVDWMRRQPGYRNDLDWKSNIQVLGGNDAINAFQALVDPQAAVVNEAIKQEQQFTAAAMLDDLFASTDMSEDLGYKAKSREEFKAESGGGFDFDFTEVSDGTGGQIMKSADEIDFYELMGIDGGSEQDTTDDEIFAIIDRMMAETFEVGSGLLLPENVRQTKAEAGEVFAVAARDQKSEEQGDSIDDILKGIFSDEMDNAFFGDQLGNQRLEWGGKTFDRDVLSDSTLNPRLGIANQPKLPDGAPSGFWTFNPRRFGESIRFDKKPAFLIVNSVGELLGGKYYSDENNEAEYFDALRKALNASKKLSTYETFSQEGYQEHDQLAPGVAVIGGYMTITETGDWAGWEVDGRAEDYRLEAGEFQLYLDGEKVNDPSRLPRQYLSNWLLPQSSVQDSRRDNLADLGFDFDASNAQAKMTMAKLAQEEGANASAIEAILKGWHFRIYDSITTEPVSTWIPSFEDALGTIKSLGAQSDYVIGRADQENGEIDGNTQIRYADVLWDMSRNKHVVDYTEI